MTDRPMLFQGDMVRGIYGDYKTKTRRACKGKTLDALQKFPPDFVTRHADDFYPYGQPGDRIWVKETYFAFGHWEQRFSDKKGRNEWHFVDQTLERGGAYKYEADGIPDGFVKHKRQEGPTTWWRRSSLFMPRAASRITLEIIDVRIERLQDISEADAIAEGAKWAACGSPQEGSHKAGFAQLWERINGQDSWAANPWVWCIQFKRVANEVNE